MVRTRTHPILDRSSPGSTGTATDFKAAGHLSQSEIQNPDSTAEQLGQWNVKLLEDQPQKNKWMVTENKEVMMCYFEANPSQRGYRKRMLTIWLSKHPDSTISEHRLADQSNVIMTRNLLTSVEIEEIPRGLSTQACHTDLINQI